MTTRFTESLVEEAALDWLADLGYTVVNGLDLLPGGTSPERADYGHVTLEGRLRDALARLNPDLPPAALEDAFRKLKHPEGPTLVARNHALHRMLVDGVNVEYRRKDGSIAGDQARVLDFDDPANNDWLTVNQFTVVERGAQAGAPQYTRRPDVVLFVNGLPLAVIELKNAADENATVWSAYHQFQTYKEQIPSLFDYNAALVISDGLAARIGSLTANKDWFLPWRTIGGEEITSLEMLEQAIRRYQNRAIETAQVIEELIALAKEMRQAATRGEKLGLTEEELAFYDALEVNDSAVKVLGDETLRAIARELAQTIRNNVTIDWTLRENVRAQMRVYVKRILRRHGYPPDKQEKATQTVIEQAEALSAEWAGGA